MVCVIQVCWQVTIRSRTELQFRPDPDPDPARKLSANLYDTYHCCVYGEKKTPDDGKRNCPKHVEFCSKNKFEKLEHLVCFVIRNPPRKIHLVPNLFQCFHFACYKHNRRLYFNTVINYIAQWIQTDIETANTMLSFTQQSELGVRWPNV